MLLTHSKMETSNPIPITQLAYVNTIWLRLSCHSESWKNRSFFWSVHYLELHLAINIDILNGGSLGWHCGPGYTTTWTLHSCGSAPESQLLHFCFSCLLMCQRRRWKVVQVFGSLPFTQETLIQFLAPSLGFPQLRCCEHLRSESADKKWL